MTFVDPKVKNRTAIPAADLYVLLQREFRRRQTAECSTCYVQLPFRVDRRESDLANWEVLIPTECTFGCRAILDDVIEEFARRYDLLPESRV